MSCHIFWQETRKQSPNTSLWRGVKVKAVVTLVTQISKHPSIYLSHRALYVLLSNNDQEVQDYGKAHQALEVWVGCSCGVCIAFWPNDLKCWFIVFLSYFQRSESIMIVEIFWPKAVLYQFYLALGAFFAYFAMHFAQCTL